MKYMSYSKSDGSLSLMIMYPFSSFSISCLPESITEKVESPNCYRSSTYTGYRKLMYLSLRWKVMISLKEDSLFVYIDSI
jgi:hypothetical protein